MTYKVLFQETAIQDAKAHAGYIQSEGHNPEAARRWLAELEQAANLLSEMPRRFKVIDEQDSFAIELRQFIHYSRRVIYHVND